MAKQRLSLRLKVVRGEEGLEVWYEGSLGHMDFPGASVHKVAQVNVDAALEAKALEVLEAAEAAFDLDNEIPA